MVLAVPVAVGLGAPIVRVVVTVTVVVVVVVVTRAGVDVGDGVVETVDVVLGTVGETSAVVETDTDVSVEELWADVDVSVSNTGVVSVVLVLLLVVVVVLLLTSVVGSVVWSSSSGMEVSGDVGSGRNVGSTEAGGIWVQ